MAWLNQRNAFSEKDLDLFDLQPGPKCEIQVITWPRAGNDKVGPTVIPFTSEESYQSWVTNCRQPGQSLPHGSLILVMHARLQGKHSLSLPYGKDTFRQTCQRLNQHRSLALFLQKKSTALFQSRTVEWEPEAPCGKSMVYQCRSDTESVNSPDDLTLSTTFVLDDSSTMAAMYGCTPTVMNRVSKWLKLWKEPSLHPLLLPMLSMELERKRLLDIFSLQETQVKDKILAMENRIRSDAKRKGNTGTGVMEMAQSDFDSTKLWLSISELKNGLESLKTQLEAMARHSRVLSDTVFTEPEGEHRSQRESGAKIVARLEEIMAEFEGKVRTCEGLLGGLTLSTQMESNYYTRQDADSNTEIARSNIEISKDAKRDSDHMQTMSFLGMMFLPGTFFATMFSMSFFQFNPSQGPPLISRWFSLYVGLTLLSTLIIFVSWKKYTKITQEKAEAARKSDEEKGVGSQPASSNPGTPQTPSPPYSEGPFTREIHELRNIVIPRDP